MLDDLNLISEIDKSKMFESIDSLPDQIKKSKDIVESSDLSKIYKVNSIIVSGMGASSIAGDILQAFLRDRFDIPIHVNRDYDLPKWADKDTLVISQSYSGNTEETISAFKHAIKKHCKIIGISSGGKLKDLCEKANVSYIPVPPGIQPRAAIGYSFFCIIYALKKTGILTIDIESEIDETISVLEEVRSKNKKEIKENENYSKQIAKKIFGTIPQVYGWDIYKPIAKRWCTQFNENSKLICRYDEVSECNHNDIVGWSMNPEVSKNFSCILFRDDDIESIYMKKRLDFMKKLFENVAANVLEVKIRCKKRLAKMMYALYIGDYVSCYLAILRKIDPSPVDIITELKNELAKL